jgi:hypothetical protein
VIIDADHLMTDPDDLPKLLAETDLHAAEFTAWQRIDTTVPEAGQFKMPPAQPVEDQAGVSREPGSSLPSTTTTPTSMVRAACCGATCRQRRSPRPGSHHGASSTAPPSATSHATGPVRYYVPPPRSDIHRARSDRLRLGGLR